MYKISINNIASEMGLEYKGPEKVIAQRVVFDSREVEPGDLFVEIRGEHVDGHLYID